MSVNGGERPRPWVDELVERDFGGDRDAYHAHLVESTERLLEMTRRRPGGDGKPHLFLVPPPRDPGGASNG